MRAIIVGGGIMGLCTAWALRRSGHEPVLYEQGPIPNPLASSCDEHRLTRFTYGALTGYARMVHAAHAAWERLWADLGQSHFQRTGTLLVAGADDGWVGASLRGLEVMDLPAESWLKYASASDRINPASASSKTGAEPDEAGLAVLPQANVPSLTPTSMAQSEYFGGHAGSPENRTRAWTWGGAQACSKVARPWRSRASSIPPWRLTSRPSVAA
jgi:glycine/D-amino acid oxidase-like deaminating enzyme